MRHGPGGRGPEGHDADAPDAAREAHRGEKGHRRGGPDGHGPGNPMKRLAKELDLSDAQKQSFKEEMKAKFSRDGGDGAGHKRGHEGMR